MNPKVSVIMPVYNGERFLREAIESVLNQTFSDLELIIVNDGSKDNSLNIIKSYAEKDSRVKIIDQENFGLASSLNNSVRIANGNYLSIIEHDDIWLPKKLETILVKINKEKKIITHNAVEYDFIKNRFIRKNGGNLSCLTFNKEVLYLFFPLPEDNKKYLGIEDGIISAEIILNKERGIIKEEDILHLDTILTVMSVNDSSLSREKNPAKIKKLYKNIILRYVHLKGNSKELDVLLKFWERHYFYNKMILILPKSFRKIIYSMLDKIRDFKNNRFRKMTTKDEELAKYIEEIKLKTNP